MYIRELTDSFRELTNGFRELTKSLRELTNGFRSYARHSHTVFLQVNHENLTG